MAQDRTYAVHCSQAQFHSDRERTPTGMPHSNQWFSDWEARRDPDPEKTPTLGSKDIVSIHGMQNFHENTNSFVPIDSISNFDLGPTSFDFNSSAFNFNAGPAFGFGNQVERALDIPMILTESNLYHEHSSIRSAHFTGHSSLQSQPSYYHTPDFSVNNAVRLQHHNRNAKFNVNADPILAPYPFPSYDKIFDTENFVPRIFHLDLIPSEPAPPLSIPFNPIIRQGVNFIDPQVLMDRIPKEVHVLICDYLEPKHIVKWGNLRKCLWIYNVRDRNIWYRAIRRSCPRNSIPFQFYPIHRNADWANVRLMAEWPSKWLYVLKTRPRGGHAYEKRIFDCRRKHPRQMLYNEPNFRGLTILLVPSGRYLVADDGMQMFFWDMKMGSRTTFECAGSITHDFPHGARLMKPTLEAYVAPISDIRVIVFFDRTKDTIGRYSIYDIRPRQSDSPCTIALIRSGSEYGKGALYAFKGDLLATLTGNVLSVQNIMSGALQQYTVHNDPGANLIMFTSPCSIAFVHIYGLTVYKISTELLDSTHAPNLKDLHPVFITSVNFDQKTKEDIIGMGSYSALTFDKPPIWYEERNAHPLIFDLVRNRKGKQVQQLRWRFQLSVPDHILDSQATNQIHDANVNASAIQPEACECIRRFTIPNQWTHLRTFGFSNDQIVLAGPSPGKGIGVTYAPAFGPGPLGKDDRGCHSSYLLGPEQVDLPLNTEFEFCPVTGRICYTTSVPYQIAVIDFFAL